MARKPKKSESVESENIGAENSATLSGVDEQSADTNTSSTDEAQEPKTNCGGALNSAREEQGLTVQEVAKQLRLGVKQIQALEADDFASLPEATIVKGFIRNYAKLLKIPSEPLVAAYNEMRPDKERHAYALNPGINMKISESKNSDKSRYLVLTLILLIVAGVWFFYQNFVQKPSPVNPIPEIVEALPELALPATERMQDDNASFQLEMPDQNSTSTTNEAVGTENTDAAVNNDPAEENVSELILDAENDAAEQDNTQSDNSTAENENQEVTDAAPAPGKTRITFSATQETWLSVVNTSGEEIYNKILYAGNRDVVDVWHPAEIVVGNAHGTTLMVDGKPIDLAPYTRINVARVRLDR